MNKSRLLTEHVEPSVGVPRAAGLRLDEQHRVANTFQLISRRASVSERAEWQGRRLTPGESINPVTAGGG